MSLSITLVSAVNRTVGKGFPAQLTTCFLALDYTVSTKCTMTWIFMVKNVSINIKIRNAFFIFVLKIACSMTLPQYHFTSIYKEAVLHRVLLLLRLFYSNHSIFNAIYFLGKVSAMHGCMFWNCVFCSFNNKLVFVCL